MVILSGTGRIFKPTATERLHWPPGPGYSLRNEDAPGIRRKRARETLGPGAELPPQAR